MRFIIAAAVLFLVAVTTAKAETFPVIQDKVVLKECGECHMAFPPQTLPKATWEKIMGDLANHFGEDASMSPDVAAKILAYHVENSSDVSNVRASTKWRMKTPAARIVDAARFVAKHKNCPKETWTHESVKSKANCLACHPTMQKNGSTKAVMNFLPRPMQQQCSREND